MEINFSLRRIERFIMGTAILVGSLLLFVSIDIFLITRDYFDLALVGQAEKDFSAKLRGQCRPDTPKRPDGKTCLQDFFEQNQDDGLRYVAFAGIRGKLFTGLKSTPNAQEAGERISPYENDVDARFRGRPFPIGDRFYYVMPPSLDNVQVPTFIFEFEPIPARSMLWKGWGVLLAGLLGVLVDIFGAIFMIRLGRQRERADRRAKEKEKLAAVGQMSAVVAHELRNPLAAAKGNTQLLAEMLEPGTKAQRKAQQTVNDLARVEHLTNDLLDFIRSGKINKQWVDPSQIIQRAIDDLPSTTPIHFEHRLAPSTWSLDPLAFERVISNLLRNAIQAQQDPTGTIELTLEEREGSLHVELRDHGPGFPEGVDVLAPFVTTKPIGNGLGLSIVEQIIKAHQGTIELSNHSSGALVSILIPSTPEA